MRKTIIIATASLLALAAILPAFEAAGMTSGDEIKIEHSQSPQAVITPTASMPPLSNELQKMKHPTPEELRKMSEQYEKLSDFYRILSGNYLDTMNYGAVVEKGIVSMLSELDPHSVYLTAKEQQAANEDLGGGFSGIGVEFNTLNDTIIVVNTIAGGPAERVGVAPNDRIVKIDGESAIGMERADVPSHLRGRKGTKVEIEVYRRGVREPLNFTITRDDIPLNTIDAAYKPDRRTGYIKVNRFGATTEREFTEAFTKFGDIDGLILDLRGNGGGYLPQAIAMSEFFLKRGQPIVSTEGNMYPSQVFVAEQTGRFSDRRLIVLVDEASASASEIVSGAIQDWDRGIIVGRTTFGKGLVQREFALDDGSAVRITIARYLTPTGRAIQRPYELGHKDEYYAEHYSSYGSGDGSITGNGAPRATVAADLAGTDSVARAFRTLRTRRRVYGGGGIRPDVIVRADTTGYSEYWSRLIRGGQIHEFTQHYLDGNRKRLTARYPDVESYIAGFDADALLPLLADYAAEHGVERDEQGMETSHGWLSSQLKALIAQRLWDMTAYYRVSHTALDDTFDEALRMMNKWYAMPYKSGEFVSDQLVRSLVE